MKKHTPKKTSDRLFDLIKSLSKQEKRYFKLFAQRHIINGKNNYMKLFELIEQQKEYDVKAIKKKLAGEHFSEQLNTTKNYLYKMIIKSLGNYHADNSVDFKLKNMMHAASILQKKMLYDQCDKMLRKAWDIAERLEDFGSMLAIRRAYQGMPPKFGQMDFEIDVDIDLIHKLENQTKYHYLRRDFVRYVIDKQKSRSVSESDQSKQLLESSLWKTEKNALSKSAKINFHHVKSSYCYFIGDIKAAIPHLHKMIQYLETDQLYLSDNLPRYFDTVGNMFVAYHSLGMYKKAADVLEKLNGLQKRFLVADNTSLNYLLFETLITKKLHGMLITGEFEKAVKLLPEISTGIYKFQGLLSERMKIILYTNISQVYFGCSRYKEALKWLNKVLNEIDLSVRVDAQAVGRIYNLIIHYELNNYELIEYAARSTSKFLTKQNRLYKLEKLMLDAFKKKLIGLSDNREKVKIFTNLKGEVEHILKDPYEAKILEYFDIISWINSKIEQRPFAEIVREKML